MPARSLCAGAVSAGAIVLTGLFTSAAAAPPPPRSVLVITARDGAGPALPVLHEVTLTCAPPGGTHVSPAAACAALARVAGRFAALEPLPATCSLEFQPVLIQVSGHWRARPVSFEREYPNMCLAGVESAGVFRFAA